MPGPVLSTKFTADKTEFTKAVNEIKKEMLGLVGAIKQGMGQAATSTKQASNEVKNVSKEVKKAKSAFDNLTGTLKKLAGAYLGLQGAQKALNVFRQTSTEMERLIFTAKKFDIKPQSLQFLEFASQRNGLDIQVLDSALIGLRRSLGDAVNGTGFAKDVIATLDMLNLKARDLVNIPIDQAWIKLSNAVNQLSSSNQKAYVSSALLGKFFQDEQAPVLLLTANLNKAMQEFEAWGGAVSDLEVGAFLEMKEKSDELSFVVQTRLRQAFVELKPTIISAGEALLSISKTIAYIVDKIIKAKNVAKYILDNERSDQKNPTSFAENFMAVIQAPGEGISYAVNDTIDLLKSVVNGIKEDSNKVSRIRDSLYSGFASARNGESFISSINPAKDAIKKTSINEYQDTSTTLAMKKGGIAGGFRNLDASEIGLNKSLDKLDSSIKSLTKEMIKGKKEALDTLGLSSKGKEVLKDILKPIPQAKNEQFNELANRIRDAVARGDFTDVDSNLNTLDAIAKSSGGWGFDKDDNYAKLSNSDLMAAAKEMRKAVTNLNTKDKTKVIIEGDPKGILQIVKAYSVSSDGKKTLIGMIKDVTEAEAKAGG